jgi:hypothetical protein
MSVAAALPHIYFLSQGNFMAKKIRDHSSLSSLAAE